MEEGELVAKRAKHNIKPLPSTSCLSLVACMTRTKPSSFPRPLVPGPLPTVGRIALRVPLLVASDSNNVIATCPRTPSDQCNRETAGKAELSRT